MFVVAFLSYHRFRFSLFFVVCCFICSMPAVISRLLSLSPTPGSAWNTLKAETAVLHSCLLYRALQRTCTAPQDGARSHRCMDEGFVEVQSFSPLSCLRWSQARPIDRLMRSILENFLSSSLFLLRLFFFKHPGGCRATTSEERLPKKHAPHKLPDSGCDIAAVLREHTAWRGLVQHPGLCRRFAQYRFIG